MHVQIHGDLPRAVNPSAYAAMYEHNLRSRKSGGLSASQSQGFHLEAELMLVGGGAGDSGGSLLEGRDLANLALDTQTVAAVECPEDCTLTEFLGLTRQRCAPLSHSRSMHVRARSERRFLVRGGRLNERQTCTARGALRLRAGHRTANRCGT